jgi:hypothetical protein
VRPRGATHTIAALLKSPPAQRLRATIAARVVDLMWTAGWTRVRVDDGTAALDVTCPSATTLLGPRMGDWFECDIIIEPGERTASADPEAAGAGVEYAVEHVTAVLLAGYGGPTGATAEAIRRIPPPG